MSRKTVSKKLNRRRTIKGGASTLNKGGITPETLASRGLERYINHVNILRYYYLPMISKPETIEIKFVSSGYNGFVIQVKYTSISGEKETKAFKILLNSVDPADYADAFRKLKKEYSNIKKLEDCRTIINTSGYFIFTGDTSPNPSHFEGTVDLKGEFSFPSVIPNSYKVAYKGPREVGSIRRTPKLEAFGVVILEYVQYKLEDIYTHLADKSLQSRILILVKLFWGYLDGIYCINKMGYIHTDIKLDNLMFNIKGSLLHAKIVDIANMKHVSTAYNFTSNSLLGSVANPGLKAILEDIQLRLGVKAPMVGKPSGVAPGVHARAAENIKRQREETRKQILNRYDLYCLAISFNNLLNTSTGKRLLDSRGADVKIRTVLATFKSILESYATYQDRVLDISKVNDNDTVLRQITDLISTLT
jgi:serine/threonine protein kinase